LVSLHQGPKVAIIVLFRSNAKEQEFVVSPGQSELREFHRRNRYPDAGTAVTVPRVPSSPAVVTVDPHTVAPEGESV
jgi:hypothetical protein